MSSEQYRLSLCSSTSIGPFNNYDPKEKSSWLCYLCGGSSVVDEEGSAIQKKSKITLSKISKTSKISNMKTTKQENAVEEEKLERNSSHRLSLKSPNEFKLPKSMIQSNLEKEFKKNKSSKILKTNQPMMVNSTIDSETIKSHCNVYTMNTFSKGNTYQSKNVEQSVSEKLIEPVRNMQSYKPQHVRSSQNITTADSSQIQRSATYVYTNPIIEPNASENIVIPQIETQNLINEEITLNSNLNRKPSIKNSSKFYQNSEKPTEVCEDVTNPHDSNLFEEIKLVDSVDKTKELKLKTKKSSSSGKSKKGSKFFMNARKVTSKSSISENLKLNESTSSSFFAQLGHKIKIDIKKVESFDSQEEDDDQYSEVLSHGQKSFLMTEINEEVSEKSRISSNNSRFKFWEDNQRNSEN